jgi:acyl-CoA thioester hydrolase
MHIYRKQILEQYLDLYGHVNNASYLTILEEARWDWVNAKGFGLEYIRQHQQGPVVLEVHLKFMKELRLREWVTIESQMLEWPGKIGKVRQQIKKESGMVATEATLHFGLFDLKERKLIPVTSEWLKAFA